jgi:hypothetical protein
MIFKNSSAKRTINLSLSNLCSVPNEREMELDETIGSSNYVVKKKIKLGEDKIEQATLNALLFFLLQIFLLSLISCSSHVFISKMAPKKRIGRLPFFL